MVVKRTFSDLPFLEDVLDEAGSGSGCHWSISIFIVFSGKGNRSNKDDHVQEDDVAPTEGLILQWAVPESMDKAPPDKTCRPTLVGTGSQLV
jgi:hypothetical protein